MFARSLILIRDEFQPGAALAFVTKLAGYHRIQGSPGFRAAAHWVVSTMSDLGVEARILPFPAVHGVRWWSESSFQEWACDDAELVLIDGLRRERLCSYLEDKISLVQRSAQTPAEGVETSLVFIEKADDAASYAGLDVKGKIVFSRGDVTAIARLAVAERGALGIVVDNMNEFPPVRERTDVADARLYTRFWPTRGEDSLGFGFNLTPRQGEALRRRFSSEKRELKVYAKVQSRFYDGQIEVVDAFIPGTSDEEVVAIAHLCHPQACANDNASGSGTLIETARTLARLISSGRLRKPRRGIRFLLLPELTGSYAYLSSNEERLNKVVAAINLDMVGQNQDLCKSTFVVEKSPRATPGFGGDLAEAILRQMTRDVQNLAGTSSYARFRWTIAPYAGGSDHYIWADPTVGITCPMLIQWPDRYYHTSQDTPDKVDSRMLAVAGVLTGTYLYSVADAGTEQASWLAGEMASHFGLELYDVCCEIIRKRIEGIALPDRVDDRALASLRRIIEVRLAFLKNRRLLDIETVARLADPDDAFRAALGNAKAHVEEVYQFFLAKALADVAASARLPNTSALPPPASVPDDEWERAARTIRPERLFRGPVSDRGFGNLRPHLETDVERFQAKWYGIRRAVPYILYWADGKRTLSQVADMIEGEIGARNAQLAIEYMNLLERVGAVKLHPAR